MKFLSAILFLFCSVAQARDLLTLVNDHKTKTLEVKVYGGQAYSPERKETQREEPFLHHATLQPHHSSHWQKNYRVFQYRDAAKSSETPYVVQWSDPESGDVLRIQRNVPRNAEVRFSSRYQ